MWNYEKRLEYPINIKRTDAAMAKAIISQFGGPDGETGAGFAEAIRQGDGRLGYRRHRGRHGPL